jgi:putative nucleotidyltransferase with HDIG domain
MQPPVTTPTPSERRPRKGRLVYTLLAAMIALAVAPVSITAWRLVSVNQERLEISWKENQSGTANSLANETLLYLQRVTAQIEQLRMAFSWGGEVSGFEKIYERLTDPAVLQPYLSGEILLLSVSDAGGRYRIESSVPGLENPLAQELVRAFEEARAGRDYAGAPLSLDLGAHEPLPLLVLAKPLRVKGEINGTIAAVVSLEKMAETARQRARTLGFRIFALDGHGKTFLYAGEQEAEKTLTPEHPLAQSYREAMQKSAKTPVSLTFPYRSVDENLKQTDMVGTLVTIPALQWGILVEIPQEKAYASVREMYRNAAYVALASVLAAAAVAAFMARRMTAPLQHLTAAAEQFAKGDFAVRAGIRSRNEIGVLADTFNQMTTDMQAYIARLQHMSEENRNMFMGVVRVLAAAIDAKDPYTRGHSERVAHFSVAIAKHLGLNKEEMERVRVGALLHDVGKIGIEDSILGKPAPLTDEEFEIMKQHPEKGARIIAQIEQLRDTVAAIRYHHERWTGGGYPTGVSGENIPMLGRIVAVADTFDAMTTERPYQKGMTFDYATAKIYELRSTKYDPKVVDALVKAYRAGDIKKGLRGSVLDDGTGDMPPEAAASS